MWLENHKTGWWGWFSIIVHLIFVITPHFKIVINNPKQSWWGIFSGALSFHVSIPLGWLELGVICHLRHFTTGKHRLQVNPGGSLGIMIPLQSHLPSAAELGRGAAEGHASATAAWGDTPATQAAKPRT